MKKILSLAHTTKQKLVQLATLHVLNLTRLRVKPKLFRVCAQVRLLSSLFISCLGWNMCHQKQKFNHS